VVVTGSVTVTISSTHRTSRTARPEVVYSVLKKDSVLLAAATGGVVMAGAAIVVDVGTDTAKMPPGM